MEEKIRIEKGSVQETLIIPLFARKKCTDKFPRLYSDPVAAEICDRLDYDFSELDRKYESTAYEFGVMEAALRQMDMMWEIEDYNAFHPEASIVCLGCGLDTDPRRCGSKGNRIYNIDFPDVIAAREELSGWSDRIRVTARGYMLGYYDMRTPGVRAIHRLLARIGDSLMKMQIVRMERR